MAVSLTVVPDGDGALEPYADRVKGNATIFMVTGLAGGMASGAASVGLAIETPDGDLYFAQTSLALFLSAADTLRARHGDPRPDNFVPARP